MVPQDRNNCESIGRHAARKLHRDSQRDLTGTGPGPLQRQVLRVLHGIRLAKERPITAAEIALILEDVGFRPVKGKYSVKASLSGMELCGRRYWIEKCPRETYAITRNGLAWL